MDRYYYCILGQDDGRGQREEGSECANQAKTAVILAKNLKLVPGDWIFYWDLVSDR